MGEFEEMTCHPRVGLSLFPNELIAGRGARRGGNALATIALRGPRAWLSISAKEEKAGAQGREDEPPPAVG